jgi:hypothetical protein
VNETITSASTKESTAQASRIAPDPWCEANGTSILLQDWVEQVAQDEGHQALRSRLHPRGQVLALGANALHVRFEHDNHLIALQPDHVRLLGTPEGH